MVTNFSLRTAEIASLVYQIFKIKQKNNVVTRADDDEIKYYIARMYDDKYLFQRLYKHLVQKKLCQSHYHIYGTKKIRRVWIDYLKINAEYNIFISHKENEALYSVLMSESLFKDIRTVIDDQFNNYSALMYNTKQLQLHNQCDRHFTINKSGEMTYTPKGRITDINEDHKWRTNGRQNIKFGKGLRKIFSYFPYMPEDHIIETIQNKLRGRYEFTGQIKTVKGEEIRKWYSGSRYAPYSGTLNDSCMRHNSCQDYFNIYTINPEKVQMIIALNDEAQLIGRAILWLTDNNEFFCDRIYGLDITIEAIKTYAKQEFGAYVKEHQSYSSNGLVSTTGEVTDLAIEITLKNPLDSYPYMDTMRYTYDIDSDTITLNNEDGDYSLSETDGGPSASSIILHNGDRIHEDDACYIDRYEEYYHAEDCYYSERLGEYIVGNRAVEVGNDYVWDDDDTICYPEDADGAWFIDDCTYSDYDNEYYTNAGECEVHGYVYNGDLVDITVGEKTFTVHKDVELKDLFDAGLITEFEYELEITQPNE